ncbi:MAG TPA: hypothetical protein VKM93_08435 [Terriglobia bacterium]|nr:hypothetical protein [Terriglobia bacterium]
MASVAQYYPGDFYGDTAATLAWLYGQQLPTAGIWQANANPTAYPVSGAPGALLAPTSPALAECGIVSQQQFAGFTQTVVENIAFAPPAGWISDPTLGPDGFPVNYTPVTLPGGNLFNPVLQITSAEIAGAYAAAVAAYPNGAPVCTASGVQTLYPLNGMTLFGYVLNLLQPITGYRVDIFSLTDQLYYQSSAPGSGVYSVGGQCFGQNPTPSIFQSVLVQQGLNGYWAAQVIGPGLVVAVLYPSSVPQPSTGWSGAHLPAGWICHSNTGIGSKLTGYFARIYSKTDIEYLQEDNIPIILQDPYHARCGSSVVPAAGTTTVHIVYQDPVAGPTLVYTSLETISAFASLPKSFAVPTSDPLYVADPTATDIPALQNRSYIYDCALAIIVYSASGNFVAAAKIIQELNRILDNPAYLASLVLENAEDGSTARWAKASGAGGGGETVTNVAATTTTPPEPPYGTGNIIHFHAAATGDNFTYSNVGSGTGLPDTADTQISFEHYEAASSTFQIDIGVATVGGKVTDVQVTSAAAGSTTGGATFNAGTKTIIIPIGPGTSNWRTTLVDLKSQVSNLTGDTLASITSFKVTLTAAGDMYFDNLSVGTLQPVNSLSFSYDTYYGQVDQAYIRTGSMAWVVYAYSIYMQLSLDYTPALYLQRMINFLLTLQSNAGDLTQGLFYLGYGMYQDPGYQYVPGKMLRVSTEHNVDVYFAFMRASGVLGLAATQLLKTATITSAQAASLANTGTQAMGAAITVGQQLIANLYIAPGALPGHFAQGAAGSTLDTSQALDASGTWTALFCDAFGRDDLATQCLEFVAQQFYLQNQAITLSSASNSYNQAYAQSTAFSGFKPYNDSAGGYSGSPASVGQEESWGMILALLRLYGVAAVATYFGGAYPGGGGGLDAFLARLITDQRTVRATTAIGGGNGSLLAYSLAARGLPYELEVWPAFASTAWFWLVATNPGLLLSVSNSATMVPCLQIPSGASQSVDELNGASSVGTVTIQSIDPNGTIKGLAAQDALIGKMVQIKQGFPSLALGDFVPLATMQIYQVGWTEDGKVTLTCRDVQRFLQGQQVWTQGGPGVYTPGGPEAVQPQGPAWLPNALPVSDSNPRYLQGHPLDIFLAALQNEGGVGQDPALSGSNYVLERLAQTYTGPSYMPASPPPGWVTYRPNPLTGLGDLSTLINPNPYLDVPGVLALRDGQFSGVWFEFSITRPIDLKSFIEDQILKVLGLYTIARADGRLSLKSMKSPQNQTPVFAFTGKNIQGIPQVQRRNVTNVVTVKTDVDGYGSSLVLGPTTAARQYYNTLTFEQPRSLRTYQQAAIHQIESTGLRLVRGGSLMAYLISDRIFRRYAFAPAVYRFKAFLSALPVELGDLVWLTHPLVPDYHQGRMGLASVVCEVIERQPDLGNGSVSFGLLDLRYCQMTTPYLIAPASAGIRNWTSATLQQKQRYMFVSQAATGGTYSDGTIGNTIF